MTGSRPVALRRAAALPLLLLALAWGAALASPPDFDRLKRELAAAAQARNWAKVSELIVQMAADDSKKAWDFMVRVAESPDTPAGAGIEDALRQAAGRMEDRKVQEAISRTARRSRSVALRRELIHHLVARGDWENVIDALGDADEEVAAAAAWGLVEHKVEAGVEPMIAAMEKLDRSQAGIWDVLRNGLGVLLGQRLQSAVEYRSKWAIVQEQGGLSAVRPAAEAESPGEGLSSSVRLFGRPIECTRVVFVLDVSGSMEAIDPDQQDYEEEGPTRTRDTESESGGGKPKGKTRLERAKLQLERVLLNLRESVRVNVIAYSSPFNMRTWRGPEGDRPAGLHALTEANRREVVEWVRQLTATGTTATDDALVRALEVEGVRCIYLLSDGIPTHSGQPQDRVPTADILRAIDEHRGDRKITIHTLGFREADPEMMRAVAEHTGGKYSEIR